MQNKTNKNLPFYIKYLNILCYTVSMFFFLFVILLSFLNFFEEKAFDAKINAMLDYCNTFNKNLEINKSEINKNENENIITEQIYKDGQTAIIKAYNKAISEANSFSINSTGKITLEGPAGLYANIQMDFLLQRYSKIKTYEQIYSNIIDTNVPESIIGRIRSGLKRVKENNFTQILKTQSVAFKGTGIVADFNNNPERRTSETELFFNDNFYIVNENTIQEVTFFKIKKIGDKIKNYYVQVKLDALPSTTNYAKVIGQQVQSETPVFNSVLMTAIIDVNGNLVSFSCTDLFDLKIGGFNCKAATSFTFNISGINEENTFEYSGF